MTDRTDARAARDEMRRQLREEASEPLAVSQDAPRKDQAAPGRIATTKLADGTEVELEEAHPKARQDSAPERRKVNRRG